MSSQGPTGKPPPAPPHPKPAPQQGGGTGGGYVNRYKLQQQRIRTLNQMETTTAEIQKRIQKSLPKIASGDKENLVIRAVQRSNTIDAIKLPGVRGQGHAVQPPQVLANKRKSLPVKTYHLRVNPDNTSFISKSLPSLPSIPGSPSYPDDDRVSPLTDRLTARDKTKVPIFQGKHTYDMIVFQKRLHREAGEFSQEPPGGPPGGFSGGPPSTASTTTTKSSKRPKAWPGERGPHFHIADQPRGHADRDKPNTSGSVRLRYSKLPREADISETQSEPSFEVSRKWKDNCKCLRCQMLQRQFQEGDATYGLWGRYPCHHVDPTIMLED